MAKRIGKAHLLMAASMASAAAFAACGALTAPISLPEAFTHNGDLGMHGTITDDSGEPLDQVIVNIDRTYYLWHSEGSYNEYSKEMVAADRNFKIGPMRAHELAFSFNKTGYIQQHLNVDQDGSISGDNRSHVQGSKWPSQDVHIVMPKVNSTATPLSYLEVQVDYTDPAKNPAIDLSAARISGMYGPQLPPPIIEMPTSPPPANLLYATVERQPLRTTGAEHLVNPLDINLPATLTLHLSNPDGGFSRFTPKPGSDVLEQMDQAPETGYTPTLVLDAARLRKMRDTADDMILDRNEFFYFRSGGKYGKIILSWIQGGGDALALAYTIRIQPNGSRSLVALR